MEVPPAIWAVDEPCSVAVVPLKSVTILLVLADSGCENTYLSCPAIAVKVSEGLTVYFAGCGDSSRHGSRGL